MKPKYLFKQFNINKELVEINYLANYVCPDCGTDFDYVQSLGMPHLECEGTLCKSCNPIWDRGFI